MIEQQQSSIEWLGVTPDHWASSRVKALFHDDTTNITVEQLAELEVDHYSIPSFDEFGAPTREDGAMIARTRPGYEAENYFSPSSTHISRVFGWCRMTTA